MIETYLLEQFAAFARCGTLLKASEELHITLTLAFTVSNTFIVWFLLWILFGYLILMSYTEENRRT